VHVQVLNATSTAGLAATTAGQLTAKGFKVVGKGNASTSAKTVIEYGAVSQLPEASTLQQEITGAELKQVSSLKSGNLNLVLGASFKGLAATNKAKTKKSKQSVSKVVKSVSNSTASSGLSANTNICHDKSAFSGPDNPSMFTNG
jgi:hypothetical protein